MKKLFKYILMLSLFLGYSCSSDDTELENDPYNAEVEQSLGAFLSQFTLNRDLISISDAISSLTLHFTSESDHDVYANFKTSIEHFTDEQRFAINFTTALEDGVYYVRFELNEDEDTKSITAEELSSYTLAVTLSDMKVTNVRLSTTTSAALYATPDADGFYLDGSGSEDSPFLIGSVDDFTQFKKVLSTDSSAASGVHFQQTASFASPGVSYYADDEYLSCYDFAGTYNGGGYTISYLKFIGDASSTSGVGLFRTLLNGADVKNLIIEIDFSQTPDNTGGLAGKAIGVVSISNVYVEGTISDGRNSTGGLIGYVWNSTLSASDCSAYVSIYGDLNIGGLFGTVSNSSITVDDFSDSNGANIDDPTRQSSAIIAHGTECVGGVIGKISESSYTLKDIYLRSSITDEHKSTKRIYSSGNYAGGVIGFARDNKAGCLEDVTIYTPVRADGNCAGGLIGGASLSQTLTICDVVFASYVRGSECVGGYIGQLSNASYLVFAINENSDNSISQVGQAYLAIEGMNNVGGIIGDASGNVSFAAPMTFNCNVTGDTVQTTSSLYGSNIGGCIGIFSNGTLNTTNFYPDGLVEITGKTSVGGIVGFLGTSGKVYGKTPSSPVYIANNSKVPNKSYFSGSSDFAGKVTADTYAGGVVGYMDGDGALIENLTFTGAISCTGGDGGGIVGSIRDGSTVVNCIGITTTYSAGSGARVGGIIGSVIDCGGSTCIKECINYADLNVASGDLGGVIATISGVNSSMSVFDLVNVGNITGNGSVGGVIGGAFTNDKTHFTIDACANYGNVTSSGSDNTGGIIGNGNTMGIIVYGSVNFGDIAAGGKHAGGIAGMLGQAVGITESQYNYKIERCCNFGSVSTSDNSGYIAGIVGCCGDGYLDDGWGLNNCYNMGAITSEQSSDAGGIQGYAADETYMEHCINVGKVSFGNGTLGTRSYAAIIHNSGAYFLSGSGNDWMGTSFSESDKSNSSTFSGFDFTSTWNVDGTTNSGYPYLRTCKYQFFSLAQ